MRRMGIEALYRRPRTSIPARDAKIYPYLLEGLVIERANQVWSSDLTYLPMAHGFLYLVAILDVASRKVLSFRMSNTMTLDFCVDALTEAIDRYGAPDIVNTDQGSQFTEDIYLRAYENGREVQVRLTRYFDFYNCRRVHQSHESQTSDAIYYATDAGDRWPSRPEQSR